MWHSACCLTSSSFPYPNCVRLSWIDTSACLICPVSGPGCRVSRKSKKTAFPPKHKIQHLAKWMLLVLVYHLGGTTCDRTSPPEDSSRNTMCQESYIFFFNIPYFSQGSQNQLFYRQKIPSITLYKPCSYYEQSAHGLYWKCFAICTFTNSSGNGVVPILLLRPSLNNFGFGKIIQPIGGLLFN